MKIKDNESIKRRDKTLFAYYCMILKKHGTYATVIPKHILYSEVADAFYISARTVYKIINKMIVSKEAIDFNTAEDLELRQTINEIHGKDKRRKLQEA